MSKQVKQQVSKRPMDGCRGQGRGAYFQVALFLELEDQILIGSIPTKGLD